MDFIAINYAKSRNQHGRPKRCESSTFLGLIAGEKRVRPQRADCGNRRRRERTSERERERTARFLPKPHRDCIAGKEKRQQQLCQRHIAERPPRPQPTRKTTQGRRKGTQRGYVGGEEEEEEVSRRKEKKERAGRGGRGAEGRRHYFCRG